MKGAARGGVIASAFGCHGRQAEGSAWPDQQKRVATGSCSRGGRYHLSLHDEGAGCRHRSREPDPSEGRVADSSCRP